jgi:hypothetical protein
MREPCPFQWVGKEVRSGGFAPAALVWQPAISITQGEGLAYFANSRLALSLPED